MPDSTNKPVSLRIDSLIAGYGKKQVLNGVTLDVASGEIVALIGHNGAGKSTLLKAVFGLIPIWSGVIQHSGQSSSKPNPRTLLLAGVAYVPQGNCVFPDLTVLENLEIGSLALHDKENLNNRIEGVLASFPPLKERLHQTAGTLSAGQKQMLALAAALTPSPKVLLLDEPSLGLAPSLVSKTLDHIGQISASSGVSVLIVEQKVREVLRISHRVCVLKNGTVSHAGPASELKDDVRLREVYL